MLMRAIAYAIFIYEVRFVLVGDVIKEIRNLSGITQEQFAQFLNVSFSTINRWENNHSSPSKLAKLRLLDYCEKVDIPQSITEKLK